MQTFLVRRNLCGVAKHIKKSFPKTFFVPDVAEHVSVFMEVDVERIGLIFNVMGEAIFDLLFLLLIRSKYTVPDDEGRAIVLVDVFLLRTVMNAMVRGRGEDILYYRM